MSQSFAKLFHRRRHKKMIKYSHKSTHASLSAKNKNEWWLALRLEVVHISLELWVLWAIDRRSRSPTRDLCHQLTCKLLLINSTSQLEAWPDGSASFSIQVDFATKPTLQFRFHTSGRRAMETNLDKWLVNKWQTTGIYNQRKWCDVCVPTWTIFPQDG